MKAEELRQQLLALFGVKPDEEFYTEQLFSIYKHRYNSKFGYFEYYHKGEKRWCHDTTVIEKLLSGYAKLIRKFWKPHIREKYYYINQDGYIGSLIFENNFSDYALWHVGNCFKTEEEAEANKDRVFGLLTGGDIPMWKITELGLGNE